MACAQVLGTAPGTWVSMGVVSDGSYGTQPGLCFSFPVTCKAGKWSIVQGEHLVRAGQLTLAPTLVRAHQPAADADACARAGLVLDEASKARLRTTEAELIEEKDLAAACLAGK